ncbi:uncharacterized protein DSM5745_03116 [Aspergillus mulundensis]|uniref:Uncharacterized protein n=1 Tax=Aspergillus mulundensis TaxID=1810919 RepID=A0A3D8SJV3_9EURO|nr:hypothetical protein DSM5745_03116 [Aspergillus mulundensis]RDW86474.1 hypothetical protein DSM5745_03116 [Aspergillus mulundensis]
MSADGPSAAGNGGSGGGEALANVATAPSVDMARIPQMLVLAAGGGETGGREALPKARVLPAVVLSAGVGEAGGGEALPK